MLRRSLLVLALLLVGFGSGGCTMKVLEYGHDELGQPYFTTFAWDGAGALCFDEASGWGISVENLGGGELECRPLQSPATAQSAP